MDVILKTESPLAVYSEFRQQLETLKADNAVAVFDYATPAGNKQARSHIFKLRKTKAAVDKARVAEKAESLRYGKLVDAEAKEIVSVIQEMILVHEKPLQEIEQQEAERVQKHKDHIEGMRQVAAQTVHQDGQPLTAQEYLASIEYLEGIEIDKSFDEFEVEAGEVRESCLKVARLKHLERAKYEAEQEELERLRMEAEERKIKDAAEAAAKAKKEREDQLRKEGEERARKDAEAKAAAERKAAEDRENQLRLDKERAEREKVEAEQRATQAAKDAKERAEREAREKAEREAAETAKREANKKHRAKFNNEALACLVAGGIDEAIARSCIVLIAEGKVNHISVNY